MKLLVYEGCYLGSIQENYDMYSKQSGLGNLDLVNHSKSNQNNSLICYKFKEYGTL